MNNTKIAYLNRRKLVFSLLLFLIVVFFSSCLNYYQDVTLYPDGSGKMRIDYWMKFVNEESEKVVDNLGIFNPDSIRSGFQSVHSKVENVNVYRDTTDLTTHAIIDISFTHIDSLNKTKAFSDTTFHSLRRPVGR